jgi:hypothetical protein
MREARAAALEEAVAISFPLKASDVEAIRSCFQKYGLKDGRVFSAFGIELDPNPALYDTAPAILPASPACARIFLSAPPSPSRSRRCSVCGR